jgi:hypothetical protein
MCLLQNIIFIHIQMREEEVLVLKMVYAHV